MGPQREAPGPPDPPLLGLLFGSHRQEGNGRFSDGSSGGTVLYGTAAAEATPDTSAPGPQHCMPTPYLMLDEPQPSSRRYTTLPALLSFFAMASVALYAVAGTGRPSLLVTEYSGPAMEHMSQIITPSLVYNASDPTPALSKMMGSPSEIASQTWLDDFGFSTVPGKELTSGLFRMNAGEALDYTYTYNELKLIVDGEFHLKDGTGQKVVARKGDVMYFPKGSHIIFDTPATALGYFCGQRAGNGGNVPEDASIAEAIASNPPMKHIPQVTSRSLPKMTANPSETNSQTWLGDMGFSTVEGKEMTTGLFRMNAGSALDYTYDYGMLRSRR